MQLNIDFLATTKESSTYLDKDVSTNTLWIDNSKKCNHLHTLFSSNPALRKRNHSILLNAAQVINEKK